jgi:hypothetical protein
MKNHREELQRITEILLRPEDDYGELAPAIQDLYQLFLTVSGLEAEPLGQQEHIYLPAGKAIGPHWAGLCIRDILRTKRFITGAFLGLQSAIAKFPGNPIHIVYAGTGPFAVLAIPLTTMFTSRQVNFTFLEINPYNIKPLKRIIHGFEAEKYVTEIIQGDATQFQAGPERPFQMIITETMQNALQKEPQVAITMNLVPQMEHDGILIPENIAIEAVLLSPKRNRDRMLGIIEAEACYRDLGTIFQLNKGIHGLSPVPGSAGNGSYSFPEVGISIPADWVAEYPRLCLLTRIRVFGDTELKDWECSLTQPQEILKLDPARPVQRAGIWYGVNEKPGFELRY